MSTYSQNPVLDDLPEEPQKPTCFELCRAYLKRIGKLAAYQVLVSCTLSDTQSAELLANDTM